MGDIQATARQTESGRQRRPVGRWVVLSPLLFLAVIAGIYLFLPAAQVDILVNAARANRASAEAHMALGEAYVKRGEIDAAIGAFRTALARLNAGDPDDFALKEKIESAMASSIPPQ